MRALPYSQDAYQLLQEGAIALAEVESNGIRIDTDYLKKAIKRTKRKIKRHRQALNNSEVMEEWKKTYRGKTNVDSTEQLGKVLFGSMGMSPPALTPTGKPKVDEKSLMSVDHPFVKDFLKIKKLKKALSTYLVGILREVQDGFLHPFFNLHRAVTYRSSSDSPNFQNFPVRNPRIKKLVRSAFIPRIGRRIVETDYSGVEVCIAACYHKDPNMISYLNDKSKDMHRDMAMECFKLKAEQMNKEIRYCGKNMFVFPQFYGDWYIDCARSLWDAVTTMNLETKDGTPLKEHLAGKGLLELGALDPSEPPRPGTFEAHIQQVEKRFWGVRFPVYAKWKRTWYDRYKARGWFKSKTGFICQGYMKRNEVINYPVQGSAFHCLLWSLTQLVQKELKRRKMKSLIIGQIHDSIVGDVPDEELLEYLELSRNVMVKNLIRHWDWITVPLEVEAEVTPIEGSWYQKKEWKTEEIED